MGSTWTIVRSAVQAQHHRAHDKTTQHDYQVPIKVRLCKLAGPTAYFAEAFAARQAAHRFLVAAMIRFRPAALIFRLALGLADCTSLFLSSAQRFRWPAAMRRRVAALIRRLGFPSPASTDGAPRSSRRISAIRSVKDASRCS
jgi:hypothetical protein